MVQTVGQVIIEAAFKELSPMFEARLGEFSLWTQLYLSFFKFMLVNNIAYTIYHGWS